MSFKPVVLVIFDGFGINTLPGESPLQAAKKPTLDEFYSYYPFTTLQASGLAVGLPWGEEGNSEVGHLTIGSGRVLYHHLPRIMVAIQDGTFYENKVLLGAAAKAKESGGTLHIAGLFSTGSVHAYVDHLTALLELAKREGVEHVALHLFGDGRDAPTREMKTFLPQFERRLKSEYPNAYVASLIGRHFSMDREERWPLVRQAYECMVGAKGESFEDAQRYIRDSYASGITDEFFVPAWLEENGEPKGRIKDGDALIFFNFREDSMREIARAFADPEFNKFERGRVPDIHTVTMTEYEENLQAEVAFSPLNVEWPLARVVSAAGKKQLHVAETEKYAHVTYFFNGGKERPFPGEDRELISSARVAFDQKPEMSANEITDFAVPKLKDYDFVIINFANADMVGHTGNFDATKKAIEALDGCLGRIKSEVLKLGGAVVLTADHGNAEEKRYRLTGETRTKHSANPVPFHLVANEYKHEQPLEEIDIKEKLSKVEGVLVDVAPTILNLMGLEVPDEMTGLNLLPRLLI